jgi:hypothetical protein
VSNDLTFDTAGNIYITDSFSPVIYKVDTDYKVSILIQDPAFAGEGFNLNRIEVQLKQPIYNTAK